MTKIILFATLGTVVFITLGFQSHPATWTVNTEEATLKWDLPYEPNPEGGTISGIEAKISFDPSNLSNSRIKASVDRNEVAQGERS